MAKKMTAKDVLNEVKDITGVETTSLDIAKAMYEKASPNFKATIGDPSEVDSLTFINGVLEYPETLGTEWVTLATRIGRTIAHRNILRNRLRDFKMDNMRMGYTLEEYAVDVAREHEYNQELAETNQYKRELPDIKTCFYVVNRKGFYKQSITDDDFRKYFVDWDGVSIMIAEIVNALYNGDNKDEYNYMKSALVSHYENGYMKIVNVDAVTNEESARALGQKITEYGMYLTEPTNEYNAMGLTKQNENDELYVVLNAKSFSHMNIDWLAQTFQLPLAEFKMHVLTIPTLPKTANGEIEAMLVDREIFRVFDQKYNVTTKYNGEGLYWNYWLHHWEGIATNRFANAIAFVSGSTESKVTAIYVSPNPSALKKGESKAFDVVVQTTGINANKSLTTSVEVTSGTVAADLSDDFKTLTVTAGDDIEEEELATIKVTDTITNVEGVLKVVVQP